MGCVGSNAAPPSSSVVSSEDPKTKPNPTVGEAEVVQTRHTVFTVPRENKISDYELGDVIGSGSYSTVLKAKRISDNQLVAVKMLEKATLKERDLIAIEDECEILENMEHPN